MLISDKRLFSFFTNRTIFQGTLCLIAGVILGLGTVVFGPVFVLVGIVGLFIIFLSIKDPEFVILLFLCFVSELIPAQFNYRIRLGFGFLLTDFILIMLVAVVIIRLIIDKNFHFQKTSLDIPFFIFFAAILLGIVNSVINYGINFSYTTYEARMFLYYMFFFPVTNLIRTQKQIKRMFWGSIVIAIAISIDLIFRVVSHQSSYSPIDGDGVVRIFRPGVFVIFVILIIYMTYTSVWSKSPSRLVSSIIFLLFCVGITTTLARNLLVSFGLSFVILILLLRKKEFPRFIGNFLLIFVVGMCIYLFLKLSGMSGFVDRYVVAGLNRISSMFSSVVFTSQETAVSRLNEISYAMEQIFKSPIWGIGFKNSYRPQFYLGDPNTSYIHNAYISIWLKTGLLGLVSFSWILISFIIRGFKHFRVIKDDFLRSLFLGITLAFLALIFTNIVAPSFVESLNVAFYSIILGLSEVIWRQQSKSVPNGV